MSNRNRRALAVIGSSGLLIVTACWNGINDSIIFEGGAGNRFQLTIEPDRTEIRATHYLVDTMTGDTWLLEVTGPSNGRWVRLTDGPPDAATLETLTAEPEEEG